MASRKLVFVKTKECPPTSEETSANVMFIFVRHRSQISLQADITLLESLKHDLYSKSSLPWKISTPIEW